MPRLLSIATTCGRPRERGPVIDLGAAPVSRLLAGLSLVLVGVGLYLTLALIWELFVGPAPLFVNHYDFLAFYSAASLVLDGRSADIFDPAALTHLQRLIVPGEVGANGYMPFLNPPFVATFLTPLALIPELIARVMWFLVNLLLAVQTVKWLTKAFVGKRRALSVVLLISAYPVYQTLAQGQLSIVLLAACSASFVLAERHWYFRSGALLAVLWTKPHLAVFVLAGLVLYRRWRMIGGMLTVGSLFVLTSLPVVALSTYLTYTRLLLGVLGDHFNGAGAVSSAVWQGALDDTAGINGLFADLLGQGSVILVDTLTFGVVFLLLIAYAAAVRKTKPGLGSVDREMMLAASFALVLLMDPHLYAQDAALVYLALPLLLYRFGNSLLVVVALAATVDTLVLQQVIPVHLFTLALLAFTLTTCCDALMEGRLLDRSREEVLAPAN